jgi:hypothetical protein
MFDEPWINWARSYKNESWVESPFVALEMSKKSIEIFPEDPELIYLKQLPKKVRITHLRP